MGLIDRKYNEPVPPGCPKTGHWVGVSNCSECDYEHCSVRRLRFKKPKAGHKLSSIFEFSVEKKEIPTEDTKPQSEQIAKNEPTTLKPDSELVTSHNPPETQIPIAPVKETIVNETPNVEKKEPARTEETNMQQNIVKPLIPKWLVTLLLIFIASIIGVVLSIVVRNSIPFWILFGFSVIFFTEKWFRYDTVKHKWFGRLYRLILNLGILALLGLVIWSGIKLFSHQFLQSALIGSILFVAEFAFFIWLWRVVSKNSWRWPSMKLTIFTLICLFVVFSFAGVQPMSSYKDTALSKIKSAFSNDNNSQSTTKYPNNVLTTPIKTIAPTNVTLAPSQTSVPIQSINKGINSHTGVYKNYNLGLVHSSEGVLSGDGCYDDGGKFIVLINNTNATNPSYNQLVSFLQSDKTDQYSYTYTHLVTGSYYAPAESHVDLKNIQNIIDGIAKPSNPDVCADFAERLHNNAEMAGIRCAYVSLDMTGYSDPAHLGIPSNAGHACNAFQTTDRGLIYIDATGMSPTIPHPSRPISKVNIIVGQQYIPVSLFPEAGWESTSQSMGTVTNMQVFWEGTWSN